MRGALRLLPIALALVISLTWAASASAGVLKRPIDPMQQTGFGSRSHWLQPWRAYLETPPATKLRDAIGINFNVDMPEAAATAKLLHRSGFSRARVEFGWNQMQFGDPSQLEHPDRIAAFMGAMRANHIRPLILLNANHGMPTPVKQFDAVLVAPARSGDTRVLVDQATAQRIAPGKTGLDGDGRAASILFTSVNATGLATLSRPLASDLSSGPHAASTLRFAPFGPPRLPDGRRNPQFEETLAGWLQYVGAITRAAKRELGSQRFDVEVWNELTFGSDFLYSDRYYDPARERGEGDPTKEILLRTVGYLRDPRHGVSKVGIGNGFASQEPWESGANSPRGLSAIDKHPYYDIRRFPKAQEFNALQPIDARGHTDFRESIASSGTVTRYDRFVPRYNAFFPEYSLSAIQTEHIIRDISPITTDLFGVRHGRYVRTPGGGKPPKVWITEANLSPVGAAANGGRLDGAATEHIQAKAALRYYTAFANKGVAAIDLYGVQGDGTALVDPRFLEKVRAGGGSYPGDDAGETPLAVRRLVASLHGMKRLRKTRPLSLLRVADHHNHRQFNGDGTAAHPPLYNRDVVAFLPFQVNRSAYVAAVYVMTRDMAKRYRGGSGATRYDLPPERYQLTIGGLRRGRVRATATDPLTGKSVRVKLRRLKHGRARLSMALTDSPRMVRLSYGRARTR